MIKQKIVESISIHWGSGYGFEMLEAKDGPWSIDFYQGFIEICCRKESNSESSIRTIIPIQSVRRLIIKDLTSKEVKNMTAEPNLIYAILNRSNDYEAFKKVLISLDSDQLLSLKRFAAVLQSDCKELLSEELKHNLFQRGS